MATVEQLTIQFEGKGASKLTGQLNALSAAMNRLAGRQVEATRATKSASKATDSYNQRLTKNGRNVEGLTGAFGKFGKRMSQIRSQLLIVAFAVGVVGKTMSALHRAVSEFQIAQGKLNGVLQSTGFVAGKVKHQLEDMANSMQVSMGVSNTSIMEMQARLLTFTNIVGKQFDETIKIATDMSNVLGSDLNGTIIQVGKALQDPILGLTALRRVGVNFTEQQKDQIKTLVENGNVIEAQKVILSELKTEFGGATQAINENAVSTKILKDLQNELSDATREVGFATDGLNVLLLQLGRGIIFVTQKTFGAINATTSWISTLLQTGKIIQKDIKNYLSYEEVMSAASTSFTKFRTNLSGYSQEVQDAAKQNENFTNIELIQEWTNSITESMSKDKRAEILSKINEALLTNNFILRSNSDIAKANQEAIRKSEETLAIQASLAQERLKQGRELTTQEKLQIQLGRELTENEVAYAKALDDANDKLKGRESIRQKSIEFASDLASSFLESSNTQMQAVKDQQKFELEQLRNSRKYQKASDKQKEKMEKEVMDRNAKDMAKAFNRNKNARYAQALIDTYSGVTRALSDHAFPASAVIASLIGAMGAQQIASIKATAPPKFAYGGLVGGKPHSQGGTMIEAERGEFVMRRSAVDAIGLETLNRLNTGQGSSSVNVTFAGNVLSKDFIEDEAIPQIKEAIRRGADIGIG